jgi:two-component system response regulator MprA
MGRLILVVDDDENIRNLLQLLLEDEGFSVVLARNGREALDRVAEKRPRLVLLDLQMPEMSGWEAHERLRADCRNLPVVFMTAGEHARREAARHGADGYLAKPFEIDDVLRTVEQFVA